MSCQSAPGVNIPSSSVLPHHFPSVLPHRCPSVLPHQC
ncbi:unnamed protein product, partial [Staurois parvus]